MPGEVRGGSVCGPTRASSSGTRRTDPRPVCAGGAVTPAPAPPVEPVVEEVTVVDGSSGAGGAVTANAARAGVAGVAAVIDDLPSGASRNSEPDGKACLLRTEAAERLTVEADAASSAARKAGPGGRHHCPYRSGDRAGARVPTPAAAYGATPIVAVRAAIKCEHQHGRAGDDGTHSPGVLSLDPRTGRVRHLG